MKQAKIEIARTELAIIEDIALASERLLSAQQEAAGVQDRRARLVATGTLDEVRALADSVDRAGLQMEISQARIEALNGELRRFYAREAQAAIDAALAPLPAIADEEQRVLSDYEQHARLAADTLGRLGELQAARHAVSVRIYQLNGTWVSADSPTRSGALIQHVKLPSAEGGADHWPLNPHAALLDAQARTARDAAALAEYQASE